MIPFVSVVIPVYNAEKYLRACLDSVVAQSLREIEIICVDDGSTDASPAVLAEYAARDPRVRVITQENAGVGPARNAGIRAARGEFVAFIDPDDLLPDESAYEALYLWAKEKRVRVCGGGVCSLANDGRRYFPDASWGSNVDQAFPRDGFMRFAEWQFDYGFYRYIFERGLLLDNEIFFPPYIRYQDPVFCARALEAAGTFYALRRPTYVFRDWHSPDYTDPRRVCDQLRGVRDLLKFSRERGRAKLHWLQIHRLFEEFKPHVLALVKREKEETGGKPPSPETEKWGADMDFIISCGPACRPAQHLASVGLRKFSAPLDWMMSYSLDTAAELLCGGFKNFFPEPHEDEERSKKAWNRIGVDRASGMVSMHDFSKKQGFDEQIPGFREKMARRIARLNKKIREAKKIGIVMNREESDTALVGFAEKLARAFPDKKFYILNSRDKRELPGAVIDRRRIANTEHYTIREASFRDAHEKGATRETNPRWWLGSEERWKTLLQEDFSLAKPDAETSAISLLKEIDALVSFPLAWRHKSDAPFRSLREEFGIQDCFPPVSDAPFPQDTVDCAFITDDGYVNMTAVAINSIRRSRAPETKVRIHVVAAALSEYSEKVFRLFEEKDFSVEIIRVEKAVLDKLATLHKAKERGYCMATPAALLKFSLPELLPNLNRVLYLDGDVLVRRDLAGLFRTPLGENYVAAVTDPWVATDTTELIRALGRNYFNSGMMLLNLELMRGKGVSALLFEEKRLTTDFRLMDQPILNRVLAGRTKILPLRFNVCPYWWLSRLWKLRKPEGFEFAKEIFGESLSGVEDLIPQNSVLLHFAGTKKPWTSTGIPFEEEWGACARDFRDKILAAIESKFLPVPSPLVSIVVPVYNVESFLPQCLNSLVKQSCSEIEVICVDDGSTDSSAKILEKYAALYPGKIRIVTQENQGLSAARNAGQSAARNAGQSAARGEYIMYVDSDDYLAPDACEKMLSAMVSDDDLAFVMCQTELVWDFDAAEEHRRGKARYFSITPGVRKAEPDELLSVPVVLWGKLFRRKTISGKKVQCPPGLKNEDEYFMPVYVECSPETRFSILPEKLYFYRQRKDSIMGKIQVSPVKSFSPDYFVGLEMLGNFFAGRGVFEKWRNYFEVKLNRALAQQKGKDPLWAGNFFDRLRRKFLENSEVVDEHSLLVSVVVPVYNTGKYLRECLDSICGQTLKNIEIICVNDGSTDDSLSILEEYAARDPRVRVFSQENFGQGHARNVGLAHARGEYVYFMDSDDCLPLAALQKEYACAKASGLDVLLFEGISAYETKELEERFPVYKELYLRKGNYPGVLSGTQTAVLLKGNRAEFVSPCCFILKREFLAQNKLRFPEGYFYEDNVFFFALLKAAERVSVVHEKLFVRRVREGSTMTKPVGFRNFLGYAHVIAELEKLAREGTGDGFKKVLLDTSAWMSRAIAGYYEAFSPEDRARSRELLSGVLKDSAWLDVVRERVAEIDAGKKEIRADSREFAVEPSRRGGHAAFPLPRFVVRLGAAFILNKAARKRWRERHMDLTPRDGIDVNAHPELRRDSALKRFAVRAASLFIFSKKKRKAFRARHLNLTPRDGVDVRALSSQELARLREAKRSRSVLRRVFDALVPATRGKIAHAERHLRRAAEEQTRVLLDELRRAREDAAETRRELARLREEQARSREEQERSREELLLRTLALKRVVEAEREARTRESEER